jgi:hypothetical protein
LFLRVFIPSGLKPHPNLLEWVAENRGELLGALLTISRYWYFVGKPRWSGRPPGSFEGWARTVGGILETVGTEGFLGNTMEMLDRTTSVTGEWETFLTAWRSAFGSEKLTAKELVERLEKDEFEDLREALPAQLANHYFDVSATMLPRIFGAAFADKVDTRHGETNIRIERAGQNRNKVALWRVVEDEETPDPKPTKKTKKSDKEDSLQTEQPRGRGVTRGQLTSTPGKSESLL